jgi:hypothetical protein
MFQKKKGCRENKKTHFIISNFFPESHAFYEKMCKNMVELDRKQRRMRFACWINTVTDTYSEYVILLALLRQIWFRERAPLLH